MTRDRLGAYGDVAEHQYADDVIRKLGTQVIPTPRLSVRAIKMRPQLIEIPRC
jgi:hypothetical protein